MLTYKIRQFGESDHLRTLLTDCVPTRTLRSAERKDLVGLGNLVIIHSAASAKAMGFNSPVAQEYLRFNSRAATLIGKQCWLCAVRLQQTVIV